MTTISERSALASYRSEIGTRKALTAELEHDLVMRWRSGDRKAGQQLIEACLPFVMTIALEYRRWGLAPDDIIQEGNIGLLKAADRFDPERGCRLVTYAAYWIRAEIREYVVRAYRIVRLGASKNERRALRLYRKTRERDPKALAEASGLPIDRAEMLIPLLAARDVNLDMKEPGGLAPVDRIAATGPSPEEEALVDEEQGRLSEALKCAVLELPPRERQIMESRWLTESPMTLEQMGKLFGISKERVRQIEERAKRRMRERIEALVGSQAEAA